MKIKMITKKKGFFRFENIAGKIKIEWNGIDFNQVRMLIEIMLTYKRISNLDVKPKLPPKVEVVPLVNKTEIEQLKEEIELTALKKLKRSE